MRDRISTTNKNKGKSLKNYYMLGGLILIGALSIATAGFADFIIAPVIAAETVATETTMLPFITRFSYELAGLVRNSVMLPLP